MNKLILMFFLVFMLCACGTDSEDTVNSDAVATGDIYATFQVVSDGDGYVYAEAQLTRGITPSESFSEFAFVRLVDKDELWLSAGEDIESLSLSDNLFERFKDLEDTQGVFRAASSPRESYEFLFARVTINNFGTWYSARLPLSDDREYRVALFRDEDVGASARNSVVVIPDTFEITSPLQSERFSRMDDDIVLEWDAVDVQSSVEVEAVTTCSDESVETFLVTETTDAGSYTISAGELAEDTLNGACSTTLNVRKVRLGQFDSRFVGGAVHGYEVRRIVIVTED